MKTAKKILSTIVTGALILGATIMPASAAIVPADPQDLFAEGFESTTAAVGGALATDVYRNGSSSYVITEDGTEPKLEIPMGEAAEAWVDKMLVAEAWYHIDGTLQGYKSETPEGATEAVVSGEQVTMAFYKDAETVNVYAPNSSSKYTFKNAVWPNTDTTGWYRIRTTGVIQSNADLDLSASKLVIGLTGAAEGTKLYVDDVKIFITDNIVDMCTQGNSDFDTYDHTCISGWQAWNCNGGTNDFGTVVYTKDYKTSGEYSVKYTRKTTGDHGLIATVPLGHFGAKEGQSVVMSINSIASYGSGNFTSAKFRLVHDYLSNSVEAYAEKNYKTTMSGIGVVPAKNVNYLRIRRIDSANITDSHIYFDDVTVKVVPAEGFAAFKKSVTGQNKQDKCLRVDAISNGDTVYPYAYFAADQADKVTLVVARYIKNGTTKRLDDISIKTFDTYKVKSFDTNQSIQTEAITVPATGEYTYKILTWGTLGGMTKLLDTAEYEVK